MRFIYCQHCHKKLAQVGSFDKLSIKCNRCKHINHYEVK